MLSLYYNNLIPESKCNWVMDSLLEGWPDSNKATYQINYGYPAAFWGFINNNWNLILTHIDNGTDWWFWDMPFWGRWSRHTDQEHYWHVAKNNIYPTQVYDCPSDRFNASGLKPKPYKSGEYIIVCPSSDTMTRWVTGNSDKDWVEDTVSDIKKYTDRPIKIRRKPRVKGMSGPDAELLTGLGSVQELLEDAHCVVTTVSLVAFEAQLQGVPTFCHPKSFAVEVSETDLSKIETPKQADRQPWFNWLGYNQFTEKEIRSGFAYETVKTLICYTTNRPKTTRIVVEFARGVNKQNGEYNAEVVEIAQFKKNGIPHHANAVMSLGILRGTGLMFKQAAKQGLDRYFLDHAYFNPGYSGKGWMRLSKNRHTMNWVNGSEGKRWSQHFREDLKVTPWRTGNERGDRIIVCPPTDAVGWYFNSRDWEEKVVAYLKTIIPYQHHYLIIVRRKPGGPIVDNKGNLIGKEPAPVNAQLSFDEELKTANFLVVHNSMVALEATRKGYPVITDLHNSCFSISNSWDDIADLHSKDKKFDEETNRRKLFYWLADNQFTSKELKSGTAWLTVLHSEPPLKVDYTQPF